MYAMQVIKILKFGCKQTIKEQRNNYSFEQKCNIVFVKIVKSAFRLSDDTAAKITCVVLLMKQEIIDKNNNNYF